MSQPIMFWTHNTPFSPLLILFILLLLCPLPTTCDKALDLESLGDSIPITSDDCTSLCYRAGTIVSTCIDDGEPAGGAVLPCYCRDKPFLIVFSSCIIKSGHCKTPEEEAHSLRHLRGFCSINGVVLPGTKAEDIPFALGIDRGGEWIPPVTAKLESSYVLSTATVTTVSYSTKTMCARSTLGVGRGDEVGAKDCPVMVTLVDKTTNVAIATTTKVSVETLRGGSAVAGAGIGGLWDDLDDAGGGHSRGSEAKVAVGLCVSGVLWGVGGVTVLMLAMEF